MNKMSIFWIFVLLFVLVSSAQTDKKKLRDSTVLLLEKSFLLGEKYQLSASLDYALIALEKAKKLQNDTLIARGYNTLGVTYARLFERDKAYEYMLKASEIQTRINDSIQLSRTLNNLGILHYYKKEYSKALGFLGRALNIATLKEDITASADPLFNSGRVYLDQNNLEEAILYFNKSIEISKQIPRRKRNLAYSHLLLGEALYRQKRYEEAIESLGKAIKINDEGEYYDLNAMSYEIYYNIYKEQNELTKANEALSQHVFYVKKSYDIEKTTTAERLKLVYQIQEGEERMAIVENEKEQQARTIQKFKILTLVIIVLLMSLLIIVYQLHKKKNELALAKQKSEQASQIKANFFSVITHELRTPLYAVIGLSDILLKESPREDQEEYLTSLNFSGKHLLALINNVLQINKIDAEKIEVESISFDLRTLIGDIVDSLRISTNNNGNTIKIDLDERIPKRVKGDSLKISQILINLIGNAIKFTKNGEIIIAIETLEEKDTTVGLFFKIIDDGIGVSKEKQQLIFDDFSQESMKVNRKYGGTGLGLAIVKKLLNVLGSDILIESEEGKGSIFHFQLTLEKDFSAPEVEKEENHEVLKGLRILIVDDNKINQLLTQKILTKKEVICCITNNGFDAIKKLQEEEFDAILMDIHMPELDGYATTREIRKFNPKVPIIALTASKLEDTAEKIKSAGMNDYISKPFVTEEFYKKISELASK
ncbi:response regulator [uncultured Kordia sp.]|uniref:hybrid sensor histidine kinase/response regulator n=1 Tax=uncultured Kordia sp. TaxID=507699 RepID=UPI00260BCFAA|nr:response regulator [uncultured Kordia sp.]